MQNFFGRPALVYSRKCSMLKMLLSIKLYALASFWHLRSLFLEESGKTNFFGFQAQNNYLTFGMTFSPKPLQTPYKSFSTFLSDTIFIKPSHIQKCSNEFAFDIHTFGIYILDIFPAIFTQCDIPSFGLISMLRTLFDQILLISCIIQMKPVRNN